MNDANFYKKRPLLLVLPILALTFVVLNFQACGSSSSGGGTSKQPSPLDSSTQVKFERIKTSANGQSFKIILSRKKAKPNMISHATVSKGHLSSWTQAGSNAIEATVTPDASVPTGKYNVKIKMSDGKTIDRTPIIVQTINDRWNQPELFAGSVNTAGWEDSPHTIVTKDNKGKETLYLSMVYMPIRSDCVWGDAAESTSMPHYGSVDVDNPNCKKVIGPIDAPERPFMNIKDFTASDGTIDQFLPNLYPVIAHGAAKIGSNLFVFKIDEDGYDGYVGTPLDNPQSINIAGDDGYTPLSAPFIFKNGSSYSMIYNNDRQIDTPFLGCSGYPGDVSADTGIDIYQLNNYDFDTPHIILGSYRRADSASGAASGPDFVTHFSNNAANNGSGPCPELILSADHAANSFPVLPTGTTSNLQGNPTVFFPAGGGGPYLAWDVEGNQLGYLLLTTLTGGTYPTGTWQAPIHNIPVLAAPPMNGGDQPDKSQPFFTDDEFCSRNNLGIDCTPIIGSNLMSAASYGTTVSQMVGTTLAETNSGEIFGVAEPTIFTYQGRECMSFVEGEFIDSTTHFDFGIGWVCEK